MLEILKDGLFYLGIFGAVCLLAGAIFTAIGSLIPGVDPLDIIGKFLTAIGKAIFDFLKKLKSLGNGKK